MQWPRNCNLIIEVLCQVLNSIKKIPYMQLNNLAEKIKIDTFCCTCTKDVCKKVLATESIKP